MGPSVIFVSPNKGQISKKKDGCKFFFRNKKLYRGEGSDGGLARDHTFSQFVFLNPFLTCTLLKNYLFFVLTGYNVVLKGEVLPWNLCSFQMFESKMATFEKENYYWRSFSSSSCCLWSVKNLRKILPKKEKGFSLTLNFATCWGSPASWIVQSFVLPTFCPCALPSQQQPSW